MARARFAACRARSVLVLLFALFELGCSCELSTTSLPTGVVGQSYEGSLETGTWCGAGAWRFRGDLPPGIVASSNGDLRGTPSQAGTFTFTATFEEDGGFSSGTVLTGAFTIVIQETSARSSFSLNFAAAASV